MCVCVWCLFFPGRFQCRCINPKQDVSPLSGLSGENSTARRKKEEELHLTFSSLSFLRVPLHFFVSLILALHYTPSTLFLSLRGCLPPVITHHWMRTNDWSRGKKETALKNRLIWIGRFTMRFWSFTGRLYWNSAVEFQWWMVDLY